jgi:hypothetical protein
MTFKELESTKRELENAGGQLDEQHIEYLKDLTEMLKDIKCVIGMMEDEEEGYSGNYYYDDDMPMARGGRGSRLNTRGGRSNARGRSNRRGYTRMESRDDFMDRFEELMDEAPDEVTRKKFEKLMMEMR